MYRPAPYIVDPDSVTLFEKASFKLDAVMANFHSPNQGEQKVRI